ncbi:hypothetical protein L1049_001218 [Liquidambar formosana]|uniref:Uncharacterized protein n=1 Tax=Liquidambar formosana TaxID=63359 RepID=A0AAP0R616_LIQFO
MCAVKNDSEDANNFSSQQNDNGGFWVMESGNFGMGKEEENVETPKHNGPVNSDKEEIKGQTEFKKRRTIDRSFGLENSQQVVEKESEEGELKRNSKLRKRRRVLGIPGGQVRDFATTHKDAIFDRSCLMVIRRTREITNSQFNILKKGSNPPEVYIGKKTFLISSAKSLQLANSPLGQ